MKSIRTYSELSRLKTWDERYSYLKLSGSVGFDTFGFDRYLNQGLYRNDPRWRAARNEVIRRDNGCDMGLEDYEIKGPIYIHHMNPMTKEDILEDNPDLFNPEFLISVSFKVHNGIHYSVDLPDPGKIVQRSPNDTRLW